MSDCEYICPKCNNTISVDYWDWAGGECLCGQEWFWDEDADYESKWPVARVDGEIVMLTERTK